jgi:hypothetical protein
MIYGMRGIAGIEIKIVRGSGPCRRGRTRRSIRRGSTRHSASGTASTRGRLLGCPPLYLGLQPDLRPAVAEIEHRAWHFGITVLVDAYRIAVREAEEICHAVGV